MYHCTQSDPYLIRERNQQILREVQTLRLESRLRKNHKARDSRLGVLNVCVIGTLHRLRKLGLAGR